ncbi:hypothetical protein WL56_38005 [Burkholderia cepacia]|nr:hypothetical protein WL56_38005 [Burkholderia cepacia]
MMGVANQGCQGDIGQLDANWQCVDEQPEHTGDAGVALHASGEHGSEHDVVVPGGTSNDERPGDVEQHGGTHAHAARCFAQTQRESGFEFGASDLKRMGAAGGSGVDDAEGGGGLIDIGELVTEEGFGFFRIDAMQCLSDEGAKLDRCRQFVRAPTQDCGDLAQHDLE